MKYWVFYLANKFIRCRVSFDTEEEALKFAQTNNGWVFHGTFVKEFK